MSIEYDDIDTYNYGESDDLDLFSTSGYAVASDLLECADKRRRDEISEDKKTYFISNVNLKNARFPSKWLDALRERNKCPYCTFLIEGLDNYNDYNEYNEGIVREFRRNSSGKIRPLCPICNPSCLDCKDEKWVEINSSRRVRSDVAKVECSSCYQNKDIWRITPIEQLQGLVHLKKPINHIDLDTLDIPCPKCLGQTVKNGRGKDWKRKCKNKECKEEGKKSTYTLRFKRVFEDELLKERVAKLFMQDVTYGVIEEMEGVNRRVASKWVSEWLYNLPHGDWWL